MTAGEHSGRGYGRDDQGYPSHDEQVGGDDTHADGPWRDDRSWPASPTSPATPSWPSQPSWQDQQAWQDQPSWQDQQAWQDQRATASGYYGDHPPPDPAHGHGGYPAGPGDAQTQAFQWPSGDYGPPDWRDREQERTGGRQHLPNGPGEPAPGGRGRRRGHSGRRGLPLWQELPLLLIIAFCLAILVRTFLLQAFYIPSGSMEDTLLAGDRVLVNKIVYNIREPARGEVVVFRGTDAWAPQRSVDSDIGTFAKIGRALGDLIGISHPDEKDYIKRIIGLPGDRISCCDVDGRIFVNGQPIDETYVTHNAPLADTPDLAQDCRTRRFDEVVVEPGQMFVLGDHRAVSQDSRCQGQVPIENIIGRAFVIVWPSSRWTGLPAPETFVSVPRAGPSEVARPDPPLEYAAVFPALLVAATTVRRLRRVPGSAGTAGDVGSRGE